VPGDPLYGDVDPDRPYEDLHATFADPVGLARSLLEQEIRTLKLFPLDPIADETGGQYVTREGIRRGLEPLRRIREELGDAVEVALELRARWSLPAAKRIAQAAEEYDPLWIEDPIRNDNLEALAEFAASTRVPTAAGENLGSRYSYRELLEAGAAEIVLADPTWCGGVTETRRIAELAAMYARPFAPHDCVGPVGLAVGVHLCLHAENALMQEIVRAFLFGWYREVADGLPELSAGSIAPTAAPGHGVVLRPEAAGAADAVVRVSDARDLGVRATGRALL
jgi:L-alanine-DL-glutamate epimerase-like enolase superfamily enzyme